MTIEQVRLFELSIKGDRLDEINAEEVLEQRASAQARVQMLRRFIHHLGERCIGWITRRQPPAVTPSSLVATGRNVEMQEGELSYEHASI